MRQIPASTTAEPKIVVRGAHRLAQVWPEERDLGFGAVLDVVHRDLARERDVAVLLAS